MDEKRGPSILESIAKTLYAMMQGTCNGKAPTSPPSLVDILFLFFFHFLSFSLSHFSSPFLFSFNPHPILSHSLLILLYSHAHFSRSPTLLFAPYLFFFVAPLSQYRSPPQLQPPRHYGPHSPSTRPTLHTPIHGWNPRHRRSSNHLVHHPPLDNPHHLWRRPQHPPRTSRPQTSRKELSHIPDPFHPLPRVPHLHHRPGCQLSRQEYEASYHHDGVFDHL